jgi:hypothetical protein
VVHAKDGQRPTYIGYDLRSLHEPADALAVGPQPAWRVETDDASITVSSGRDEETGDGLSVVRAIASAVWEAHLDDRPLRIKAGDDTAQDALQRWSLA